MDAQSIAGFLAQIFSFQELATLQFYGFLFLMGSLTVASLSDLKRMAAQREFAEVWLLFSLAAFAYDFLRLSGGLQPNVFFVKWLMIGLFALVSWRYFGFILSLSEMDLTAACAALSLLSPLLMVAYYLLLLSLNLLMKPFLKRFGDGISIPFLPVILAASLAVLLVARLPALPGLAEILH